MSVGGWGGALAFNVGELVAVTGSVSGRVWWADSMTVVRDDLDLTVLYMGPGAEYLMPDRIHKLSPAERHSPVTWSIRSSGEWNLMAQTWRSTHVLTFLYPNKAYAIRMFFSEKDWKHICWYVNFQRPYQRTAVGFEALDLILDVVVPADDPSSRILKDQEQYLAGVKLGQITNEDIAGIERSREELAGRITELRFEPFQSDWTKWRPQSSWPVRRVPALRHFSASHDDPR